MMKKPHSTAMQEKTKPGKVRTSEKTFDIIETIIGLEQTTLSDISTELGISPSTAHRHLNTLVDRGYVVQEKNEFYLGTQFLTKGGLARRQKEEYQWAEDYVQKLAENTNERAQFEIEENGERVFLFRRTGQDTIREKSLIGRRGPMHASAAGKAILAEYPDEEISDIIAKQGLVEFTENTITDVGEFFDEIKSVREQGYATNFEESQSRYNAIGASVTDTNDEVVGALSVSGPSYRLNEERIYNETLTKLLDVVEEYELYIEYNSSETSK